MKVVALLSVAAAGASAIHIEKTPFDMTANGDTSCFVPKKASQYRGLQDRTKSGRKCQAWAAVKPHAGAEATNDAAGSAKGLGNHAYCRQPTQDFPVPWCYTVDPQVEKEECNIPQCEASGAFLRDFPAEAHETALKIGSKDCQCADQLYGATTTSKDTSVAGASLLEDGSCPCGETVAVKQAQNAIRRRAAGGATLRGSL